LGLSSSVGEKIDIPLSTGGGLRQVANGVRIHTIADERKEKCGRTDQCNTEQKGNVPVAGTRKKEKESPVTQERRGKKKTVSMKVLPDGKGKVEAEREEAGGARKMSRDADASRQKKGQTEWWDGRIAIAKRKSAGDGQKRVTIAIRGFSNNRLGGKKN